MAFVIKTAKTLRNHWKKSTFAAIALLYGYDYAQDYFQTQELMRVYCEKASKYGDQPIRVDKEPRNITVILNPNANKRKASDEFEKYCAPILHLAGICVNVIKTESEGHAKTLINDLDNTDAIVVAGGDGTLSEVITGLLRRTQENTNGLIPIGLLPLGKTNSVAKILFPGGQNLQKIQSLGDATMAIVEEVVKPIDVLKVEVKEGDSKPIYAASGVKWGAYRDAESKRDSYWLYGRFRNYMTYIFNGYRNNLTWNCEASLTYSPPCNGCSNCVRIQEQEKKWFSRFSKSQQPNYAAILNPECQSVKSKDISTVDFNLAVDSKCDNEEPPKIILNIGPKNVDYLNFIKQGWRSENGESRQVEEVVKARSMMIEPRNESKTDSEQWLSIDNENYELKPIKVTLLPKLINVFCKK